MIYFENDIDLLKKLIKAFNGLYQDEMDCISEELADILASLECYNEETLEANGLDIMKYKKIKSLSVKDLGDSIKNSF